MKYILLFTALMLVLFAGCSGTSTVTPDQKPEISADNFNNVGVSDYNTSGAPSQGMGALGLFNLNVDPINITAELTPIRRNSLVDVLEVVDLTTFMRIAPCTDCVYLKSVSLDGDSNLVLNIGIKHPFGAGDPFKPISGKNRGDLHVFNVEGIIAANSAGVNFPMEGQKVAGGFTLVNADGYTGYLDPSLDEIFPTDATIHPYITHFDDYSSGNFNPSNPTGFESVTNPGPSGNLVMPMGCDFNFQDYIFKIDQPSSFIYAVGCTYAVSAASKSMRFTPEYRVPQHNKKAASEVNVEFVSNDLKGGIASSSADLEIHVVDISHGVAVGDGLDQMFADSSVASITVEVPGVLSTPVTIPGNSSTSGTGHSSTDPLIFPTTISNQLSAPMGTYNGLVKVLDTYAPGQNTVPLLNGQDGIKRVSPIDNPLSGLFTISEFATYQFFTVDVATGCGPITGEILSPVPCPSDLNNGATVNFQVTATSANGGGNVIFYEVDYDYDGTTFTADASNATGTFNSVGPFTVPDPCSSNIPHTFNVAFRGTDECVPPNVTIFADCDVTVTDCETSVGNVWITVNRVQALYQGIYDLGDKFDPAGEWTIHWNTLPGTAQYAIYYDNNPGNYALPSWTDAQLTDNLVLVGTSTGTAYTVPVGHVPANHWVPGNTYIVRARTVMGDPASEGPNSEPAFITTTGWETCPASTVMMDPNTYEGWLAGWETANAPSGSLPWYYFPCIDNFYQNILQGARNARISGCMIGDMGSIGRWTSCVKRTPVVPNAPVRFLDFALQAWNSNNTNPAVGGVIIGTCSIQPGHPWTTPTDFEWAKADTAAPMNGYNNGQDTYLRTVFSGVDTSQNWCMKAQSFYQFPADIGFRIGGDVNANGGDPADPFVGYAAAKVAYTYNDHDNWFSDELAILIY